MRVSANDSVRISRVRIQRGGDRRGGRVQLDADQPVRRAMRRGQAEEGARRRSPARAPAPARSVAEACLGDARPTSSARSRRRCSARSGWSSTPPATPLVEQPLQLAAVRRRTARCASSNTPGTAPHPDQRASTCLLVGGGGPVLGPAAGAAGAAPRRSRVDLGHRPGRGRDRLCDPRVETGGPRRTWPVVLLGT